MGQFYSHGIWVTKPGRAKEFIDVWSEFAEWTKREVSATATGTLLRDIDVSDRFISFGPWESLEQIEDWRSREGFRVRVEAMRELLEGFDASNLEQVAGPDES